MPIPFAPQRARTALPRQPLPTVLAVAIHCALIALPSLAMAQATEVQELPAVKVMGEKMGRSEQDSTAAVTVYTAEELEASNKKTLLELVGEVPNVTVGEFGGVANIRGSNGAGPGFSSLAWKGATRARTATVLDGVSKSWPGGNLLSSGLWDVEQVEILRGPQSTMQGRSAVGGAVVLKSKDPSFKQEGAMRVGIQQANGKLLNQAAGVVSGPLSDSLAYRLSADVSRGSSFINYVDDNSSPGVDFSSDPDKIERNDIKAKLLWAPTDNPNLISRLDVQHQSQKGPYLSQVDLGDSGEYNASMSDVNHRIGDTTVNSVISNTTYQLDANRSVDVLLSLTDSDFGYTHNQTQEATSTASYFDINTKQEGVGVETRLNLADPASKVKSMVGASFFKDDMDVYGERYSGALVYAGSTLTSAASLFGEVDYPLNDQWALVGGGRVERESQDRTITNGVVTVARDSTDTYLLPRIGTRFNLDAQTVFGLDLRKGYNPAGISMDTEDSSIYTYEAEYVTAIELSFKKSFNEGRGSVAVNVFNNAFKDYQAKYGRAIANVDEANIRGIELSIASDLGSATHVYANASFQSSEVKAFATDASLVGNDLPYAAPRTFGVGVSHKFTPVLTFNASAKYVGAYYVDVTNLAGDGQEAKAGDYSLVDVSLNYDINKKTSVRAYANNLFDTYVINTYFQGTTSQDVLSPRTVGLQLDYRF